VSWSIERVQTARVAPSDVFALYADPTTWTAWGHNATRVQAHGPLVEGGTIFVRANYGRNYPCLIRRLVPGRALDLEVHLPGMRIVNVYEVEPTPEGSRIRHVLEFDGRVSYALRLLGAGILYGRLLDREIHKLVELASSGPTSGAGAPTQAQE
jgi:hypothetical protein